MVNNLYQRYVSSIQYSKGSSRLLSVVLCGRLQARQSKKMIKGLQSGLLCVRSSGRELINSYISINIGIFSGMAALRPRETRCSTRKLGRKLRICLYLRHLLMIQKNYGKLDQALDARNHLLLPHVKLTKSRVTWRRLCPRCAPFVWNFRFVGNFLTWNCLSHQSCTRESEIKMYGFTAIYEKTRTEIWYFLRHYAA